MASAEKIPSSATQLSRRPKLDTKDSTVDSTLLSPGIVKINVQGAYIVSEDPSSPINSSQDGAQHDTDIRLPNHQGVVSHIALDIGGSLAKLVYFSREPHAENLGGSLHFLKFEADQIDRCLEFVVQLKADQQSLNGDDAEKLCVIATGGGAFKHYDTMKKELGIEVIREDEMECLILGVQSCIYTIAVISKLTRSVLKGLDFFISEIPREVFSYSDVNPTSFVDAHADIYPYLLVNIGSGVSMIKVSGKRDYQRIGGTSLGGGTFWGLLSLLTGASTFDEMLKMADRGDNARVDMLVGDIYGTDYGKIGLKSNTIASSFGKVFKTKRQAESHAEHFGMSSQGSQQSLESPETRGEFGTEDISRSLLLAVSNNIGQIAYLQSEKHQLEHIYFGGSFIRGHQQTIKTLSYAINFWSEGSKKAYFLRHEGYLGSVGAFVKRQPKNWGRKNSFE